MKEHEEKRIDALEMAHERDIAAGKAIEPECPECGMQMVYNTEDNKYHCMGVNNGCFYSEDRR